MYCSGAVRDYRFVYDLAPPTIHTLMDALQQQQQLQLQQRRLQKQGPLRRRRQQQEQQLQQRREPAADLDVEELLVAAEESEGVEVALSTASSSYPNRSLQPLVPAACAMALLPRGGRMHAGEQL